MISIGQFLCTTRQGSYEADDNDYLADFLTICKHARDDLDEEEQDLEIEALPADFTVSAELCNAEKASLFYLAGYCVHSMEKGGQLCAVCVRSVRLSEEDPAVSSLLRLREYRPDALFSVSKDIFKLCYTIELVIRRVEAKITTLSQPLQQLINKCLKLSAVENLSLPSCHNIKDKLVRKFITVRLRLLCRKLANSQTENSSTIALGSKTTAMRDWASKVR